MKKKRHDPIALQNVAKLEKLRGRMVDCAALFTWASKELQGKIDRILDQESPEYATTDRTKRDRIERISLTGSAHMERAAQDLEVACDSAGAIIKKIRQLSAGEVDDDDDDNRRRNPVSPQPSPQGARTR